MESEIIALSWLKPQRLPEDSEHQNDQGRANREPGGQLGEFGVAAVRETCPM